MSRKTLQQHAEDQLALASKELDPDIKRVRMEAALYYFKKHADGYELSVAKVEIHMGDKVDGGKYNISGQAGAVGPGSKAEGNIFNQAEASPSSEIDLQKLADELSTLVVTLRGKANPDAASTAVSSIEEAQVAAQQGDMPKALSALSGAGETAIDEAKGIGAETAVKALRKSFKIATDLERAHIQPWIQLGHKEYLEVTERIDGLVPDRIWGKLERYGICLIRLLGHPPEETVLEEIVKLIGFAAEEQNDYAGAIKDINPAAEGRANSGDTTSELGFHVDGTQDPHQPALLAFQYVRGAKLGANSRFADAAGILHEFDDALRYEILTTLARSNAATFSKIGMGYEGPIFSFSPTDALMCRIRFDSVITVREECRQAFDLLKQRFEDLQNSSMFLPNEGDIVVFDNWRIMHARDEIHGPVQRHHRRAWIGMPRHEHQMAYQLGIRPIPIEIAAKIKEANTLK